MSRAQEGFDQLAEESKRRAADLSGSVGPTWSELAELFKEAAKVVNDWEYSDRMGDDM